MRRPEQRLWDRFRNAAKGHLRLERVENIVTVGMPDVLSLSKGAVAWVELKSALVYPARNTTAVLGNKGLSIEQRNWHNDWARWGGKSYLLVGVASTDVYLIGGQQSDAVNTFTREELEKHALANDWSSVISRLKT